MASPVHPRLDLTTVPAVVPNGLGGGDVLAADGRTFPKLDPATGRRTVSSRSYTTRSTSATC